MELYLAYIPFTTQNAIMQTNGSADPYFKIADATFYKSVEVQNFRILDNGKISFIIDLKESSIENLDYDNYNAVVTKVYKSKYKVYRIKSISYTSATNYLITAVSHYVDAIYGENQQLIDPTSLKSHVSKIKYGYAYDSLIDSSGRIKLDRSGSGDIYLRNPNYEEPNIPVYSNIIPFNNCYYNTTLTSEVKNNINTILNRYVLGWKLYYYKSGAKKSKGDGTNYWYLPKTHYITNNNNTNLVNYNPLLSRNEQDGSLLPFNCIATYIPNYKKLKDDKVILTLKGLDNSVTPNVTNKIADDNLFGQYHSSIIDDDSSWLMYTKMVRLCPILDELFKDYQVGTTVIDDITYTTIDITLETPQWRYSSTGNISTCDVVATPSENSGFGALALYCLNAREHHSLDMNKTYLGYYPSGYNVDEVISKSDFKDYRFNPYITANTYKLKIVDNVGGEYSYTPLDLGHFNNLRFLAVESLTPDVTKYFVWVDPLISSDGLITANLPRRAFMGLINNVDFSYPFNVSQLDTFLANNKNFFLQKLLNIGGETVTGTAMSTAQHFKKMARADLISTGVNAVVQGASVPLQLNNLENAPGVVQNMNGNVFFATQYDGLPFRFIIYTTTDLTKQTMYNDFVAKGMYLNRYISKNEVHKYVSITDNAYDKSYYKYCEGDFDFYVETENGDYVNNKNIVEIKNLYANGTAIYNVPLIITDNPLIDFKPYQSNYELAVIDKGDEGEIN